MLSALASWPRWALMWLLAFAIFCGCKWLTWFPSAKVKAGWFRHAAYLFCWPGLDPKPFLQPGKAIVPAPQISEWLISLAKMLFGLALFFLVARHVPETEPYLVGWVGMVGLIFILHFGLFHLLACFWRAMGVAVKPLMNFPVASESVSEFWGKRWNLAFRDLTHRFVFRPLAARWNATLAVAAVFLFSGLIHDAVISLPAGGGFGGPMLFFVIQGIALFFERSSAGRKLGLGHGWRGRTFTLAVLLGPVCLLFHRPFVDVIILPMMKACGALP